MADTDQLKKRAVMVRGGSGVIVPAMSKEYAYVLTALHNVLENPSDRASQLRAEDVDIVHSDGTSYKAIEIFKSHTADAAVLMVPYTDVAPVSFTSSEYSSRDFIWLAGYPNSRRTLEEKYKLMSGEVKNISGQELHISTDPPAPHRDVLGFSGGGVYCESSSKDCVLIGIEYSMEGPEDELQRWLKCLRISVFEKIILESSFGERPLAPLLPPYLLDFLDLVEFSFPLEGFSCATTQGLVRELLWDIARDKLARGCPSPHAIREKFGELLLVAGNPIYRLADKKLWLSWVELLVISVLLDDPTNIDEAYIEGLRRRRRLLYSGEAVDWANFVRDIARSNLAGLDDEGIVLVTNEIFPRQPRLDISKIIPDISRATGTDMDIGSGSPARRPIKFMHLEALNNECLAQKENAYMPPHQFERGNIINRLVEAYREAIAR